MGRFLGWLGEKKVRFKMWLTLNRNTYQRLHNIIIPSQNGTTQIDHLIISPYGVFIVETKNLKGWIFGSSNDPKWTQVIYGNNYPFQNPIRQTFRQRSVLSDYLNIDVTMIHTVIYFVSDCEFKTDLPFNVISFGLSTYIKQYQKVILFPKEISFILNKLNTLVSNPSFTARNHLRSLHERHNSNTVCPKCGSKLVERMANKGPETGSKFLGCENYPKCRFTKKLT